MLDFASPLPHPGEILREDFMEPLGLTAGALAKAMGLKDRTRIERLSRERQPITADTAARLARVFGNSAQFWLNLQTQHDLSAVEVAEREELGALQMLPQAERVFTAFIFTNSESLPAPPSRILSGPLATADKGAATKLDIQVGPVARKPGALMKKGK